MFINDPTPTAFTMARTALKLENVKQLKMRADEKLKRDFLIKFYTELGYT
jgi:hypothetical protein